MIGMDRARGTFPHTWEEVCNDPHLANLPYRVEINLRGNIELSPHTNWHSDYQAAILRLLDRLMKGGSASPEYAITARNSVPVADVVWASRERRATYRGQAATRLAPEICVEVRSPSNTWREMENRRQEYFEAGALEFWFCDLSGTITFYGPEGELEQSRLCPKFPKQVKLK